MINKAKVKQIVDKIDADYWMTHLEQLANTSSQDNVKLSATKTILEVAGVLKNEGGKVKIDLGGARPGFVKKNE